EAGPCRRAGGTRGAPRASAAGTPGARGAGCAGGAGVQGGYRGPLNRQEAKQPIPPGAITMPATAFERLEEKLRQAGVPFTVSRHAPVYTSEEAAAVRGTPLSSGAKALVVKAGDAFVLLVLPADRKL